MSPRRLHTGGLLMADKAILVSLNNFHMVNVIDHRAVRSAEFIIGRKLPALQDTYHTRCLKIAGRTLRYFYHPSFSLFTPLPYGRRYRSIRSDILLVQVIMCIKMFSIVYRILYIRRFIFDLINLFWRLLNVPKNT